MKLKELVLKYKIVYVSMKHCLKTNLEYRSKDSILDVFVGRNAPICYSGTDQVA
jgi:hypothetical protein